jgi:hypothetical protein
MGFLPAAFDLPTSALRSADEHQGQQWPFAFAPRPLVHDALDLLSAVEVHWLFATMPTKNKRIRWAPQK